MKECETCKEQHDEIFIHTCEANHRWMITDNLLFETYVKKTRYNRFKWWLSTKLLLPGTYEWKE